MLDSGTSDKLPCIAVGCNMLPSRMKEGRVKTLFGNVDCYILTRQRTRPAVVSLCARPGVLAQSCISGGTEANINAALNGAGAEAILCASAVFTLQNPVQFSAINQQIYTVGLPTGSTRAILRVTGSSQSTAIEGNEFDGTVIKSIEIDGNRPALGLVSGGDANIEVGSASNQVIDNVFSHDPRGWSCMHITQGRGCHNATVSNNQVGPAGNPNEQWADGISLECIDALVTNNVITDATDGAIVIFGSPGSVIKNNVIIAKTRVLLGGINMVDTSYGGIYLGTRVFNNTINAQGAFIKTGIAMGPQVWSCPKDGTNFGAIVTSNTITGAHFGFGYPVNGVSNWTVSGNVDNARHVGVITTQGCYTNTDLPAGFQRQRVLSSTLQAEYVSAGINYTLGVDEPSILAGIQSPTACGILTANQGLIPGQTQKSCDGRFALTLQAGGNLVLTFGSTQLWQSSTSGKKSAQVLMQGDGNFVMHNSTGNAIWNTATSGNNGATFNVQNDGNLVIYSVNGNALWSSSTCCHSSS